MFSNQLNPQAGYEELRSAYDSTEPHSFKSTRMNHKENRVCKRKIISIPIRVIFSGKETCQASSIDISKEGLCIVIANKLEPDTLCTVSFELFIENALIRFDLDAQVCYCTEYGHRLDSNFNYYQQGFRVGLKFVNINPLISNAIEHFVELRIPGF